MIRGLFSCARDVGFCLVGCCGLYCSLLVPGCGFLFLGACVGCAQYVGVCALFIR